MSDTSKMSGSVAEGQGQIRNGQDAKRFMLAGNARVTFVSLKTGTRFTYHVRGKEEQPDRQTDRQKLGKWLQDLPQDPAAKRMIHFVRVLTGPDNNSDYEFIGTIFESDRYVHGRRARIGKDAPSVRAFLYAWEYLKAGKIPPLVEVWHEGHCGKCGRLLTVPESLARGIGPDCAGA